ncbi:hypothetical protein E4U56_003351 [Claviceps arundinis]|uniref:Uncharacterized protein n=1 Tax=Claviceps arundinis TaxID=1623583 RepID=A0A9P7SR77_9HYPO|nr:hypothetical protein E4U56_003351 [Claviceps arundinis]
MTEIDAEPLPSSRERDVTVVDSDICYNGEQERKGEEEEEEVGDDGRRRQSEQQANQTGTRKKAEKNQQPDLKGGIDGQTPNYSG